MSVKAWLRVAVVAMSVTLGAAGTGAAQSTGRITGKIVSQEGVPLGGVMVLVQGLGLVAWSDTDGRYVLARVPPGTYTLVLSLGSHSDLKRDVVVPTGAAVTVDATVDWPLFFTETVVVTAASRRLERIVDAPAAMTVLTADEIAPRSTHGQLPRLLARSSGVELVQSGLYDFNINSRGFNTMLNRRILTVIDGRDPSIPHFVGFTDWATIPFGLDDLDRLEFVRGPAAALYGAGAFNGVLSLTTKAPRDSLGGRARVTVGELDTRRVDARHAGELGRGWYFKVGGGYQESRDFTRSRVGGVEYAPGILPTEAVAPALDHVKISYGSLRADKYFDNDSTLVVETGSTRKEGPVLATAAGRSQATDTNFPWARVNVTSPRWSVLGSWSAEDINDQLSLSSGGGVFQSGYNAAIELQGNRSVAAGRGRLVGGVSYGRQTVDSANAQGAQTILAEIASAHREAIFGQADYNLTPRLKAVFAARVDNGTLHDAKFSPRAAVLYEVRPKHRLRLTFGQAFQSPSIVDHFLITQIAPPLDLSAIEAALRPALGGVSLGFANIPLLVVGNTHLKVEEISSIEAAYSATLADRVTVNVSYFHNGLKNFTSNVLPNVGTTFGRLNPDFGPYRPPAALSPAASATVLGTLQAVLPPSLFGALSNLANGSPAEVLLSLGNFGQAQTQGVELGVTCVPAARWRFDVNYGFLDANIEAAAPENPLMPNAPRHQLSLGLMHTTDRFNADVGYRWVGAFDWASGLFAGPVPSYGVADLNANYVINKRLTVGVDVANLFENRHYEMFGGDLIGRRALTHLTTSW